METTSAAAASTSTTSPEGCVCHVHTAPPFTPSSVLLRRRRLLIALGALLVALATAAALRNGQALLTWDLPIQHEVEENRTTALNDMFLAVSRLGSTVFVLIAGSLGAILTWRRCRAVATALLVATFARPAIEFIVKGLIGRDRPDFDRLVAGTGPSFPSGHVMAAMALWGLLPVVVALYTRRRAIWWASVGVSAVLIAGIAASRVYLGVHWFSDVTAGLVVGTFFLLGVDKVLIRAHRRYPCKMLAEQAERERAQLEQAERERAQLEQAERERARAAPAERTEKVPVGSGV